MLKNIFYLSLVNISNYIIPLFLIPYAIHALGFDYYGRFSFALAIISYFVLLVDFGIGLIGTKEICENPHERNKITYTILFVKLILFCISCVILIFIVLFFKLDIKLYSLFIFYLFGVGFTTSWYFQAIENMKILTISTLIPKLIFLPMIFIFVKDKYDIYIYTFLWVIPFFISTLICILYIMYKESFHACNSSDVKLILEKSYPMFVSLISIRLYTVTNTVIIGLLINDTAVGVFSSFERLIRAIISITSPINSVLYPRINKIKSNLILYRKYIRLLTVCQTFIFMFIVVFIFILYDHIIPFILSNDVLLYKKEFYIFAIALIVVPFSNILGTLILIPMNLIKEHQRVILLSSICHVIYIYPFVYFFGLSGGIIAYILTESIVLIGMLYFVIKIRFFNCE
ncbi:oligosaccharide flippase family protein [Photobacterium damselae]|uniref:oligosaccharide flippase family protein n=1 Tax=Photobacterium damselae TaxID=38293 RepID=UPI0015E79580|nr:oligosaccharide flippase family protein [Photobacterium damselae]